MSNGHSIALDYKAALVAAIRDLPEAFTEKWDVDWGFSKNPERTWVYVGRVTWDTSTWATNRSRQETFKVQVAVNVRRRRMTPEKAERECLRIAGLIEAAVKANPQLGIGQVVSTDFTPTKADSFPGDDATEAQFEAEVWVTARF